MIALDSTQDEVLAEIERVRVMYRLKHTMRYLSVRDHTVHSESVAEHLFAMQVVAQYFYSYEDPEGKLDRVRVNELMLFHEIGEIETGDLINHRKTREHRAAERQAAARIAKILPRSMQEIAINRFREFEAEQTAESRYANAIDKLEPIFEMWDEQIALPLYKRHDYSREAAVRNKYEATARYPYMRKFIEAWESRAVALDIFPS